MSIEVTRLREVADKAQAAGEAARTRRDAGPYDDHVDEARHDIAYAEGVEDALRWLAGDTKPTEKLAALLATKEGV